MFAQLGHPSLIVWQTDHSLIFQTRNGTRSKIPSPGYCNTFDCHRLISLDGKTMAFPGTDTHGGGVYTLNIKSKKVSRLLTGESGASPRLSSDGHFLVIILNDGIDVFDVQAKRVKRFGDDISYTAWARHSNVLLFKNKAGQINAYNASSGRIYTPSLSEIDGLIGSAYRLSATIPDRSAMAEVSPSGKWAFLGAVSGGLVPDEINGHYYPDMGTHTPYSFGVLGKDGQRIEFSDPEEDKTEECVPLGWTRNEILILEFVESRGKVLEFNPATHRCVVRKMVPIAKGAIPISLYYRRGSFANASRTALPQ